MQQRAGHARVIALTQRFRAQEQAGGFGTDTGGNSSGGTSLTKKTVITLANLDEFAASGIKVNNNVILSPLAKDEAVARGIPITYL